MDAPARIPNDCPGCRKPLGSASGPLPPPRASRRATFLYVLAGTVAALTYYVGLVILRELLKVPIGHVAGTDLVIYRVPPTVGLSVVALPVALVPGFAVGWLASRLPDVRRVRCRQCGWSATFPATARRADPPPAGRTAAAPSNPTPAPSSAEAFEVVADDDDPWKECAAWAYAEIRRGRVPEDVEADLAAQGWPPDDVAGMVERCRKEARQKRG